MFKLDFQPYNKNRIDCYWNNIVAILITKDPSYERLVAQVSSRYEMPIPDRNIVDEDEYRKRQETGMLIPHVRKKIMEPLIEPHLEAVGISLQPTTDIVDVIQRHLRDGMYCFVHLNRFHLPGCLEYEKTELIHPILVYGYDDANEVLYVIEDCMPAGKLDTLEVRYPHIYDSYASLPQDELFAVGMRTRTTPSHSGPDLELIRSNLLRQLQSETEMVADELILKGLEVLPYYRRRFAESVLSVRTQDINVYNRLTTPIAYQERNQMLTDILGEAGILSTVEKNQLQKAFVELARTWEYIRLKAVQYFKRPQRPPADEYTATSVDRYLAETLREKELLGQLLARLN